jgi:TRAP-type C4-dicarboxylate transport system substrate-binding protein
LGGGSESNELLVADFLGPENTAKLNTLDPWMEKVQEEGDIEFEYQGAGSLGGATEMLSILQGGTADVTFIHPDFIPGELILSEVGHLPNRVFDPEVGNVAYWELTQNELYEEELSDLGIRNVCSHMEPPFKIFSKEQVLKPEDLDGSTIRASGGIASLVAESLGASANALPTPEVYTALEQGTVEGAITSETATTSWDWDEQIGYGISGLSLACWFGMYAINEDAYEDLSNTNQEALNIAGEEISRETGKSHGELELEKREELVEAGIEITDLSDERQTWEDATAGVEDEWVSQVEGQGLPASDMVEAWDKKLEEAQ